MAIAEILFLKLIDEFERLSNHKGNKRCFQERYLWSNFVRKYRNDDQGLLDFVSGLVWPALQKKYAGIFNDSFSIRKPATLKAIIGKIDPINLTATDTDVKGDAFEYFLKTVTNGNKDLGEYFTPRHIVRTMVNLVKPIHGETIYDPFCGNWRVSPRNVQVSLSENRHKQPEHDALVEKRCVVRQRNHFDR